MTAELQIISRKEAKARGLSHYFTGKPCVRQHIAKRAVSCGRCVECNKVICLLWQTKNRKERSDYSREWYHRDVDARRAKLRARRASNPDELRKHNERNEKWRQKNPGWVSEWRAENPENHKANVHRRRSLEKGAEGNHTAEDLKNIYSMQGGLCAYCRKRLGKKYQLDHIVPLSKGGTNYPNNIQLLCGGKDSCNQKKRAKNPFDYARSLGLLI